MTELLVVISIFVLLLTMGAGVWQSLSGRASVEAAFNQLSAAIGTLREEARAIRTPRGAFFYKDETGRVGVVPVFHNDPGGRPGQVEQVPGSEVLLLKPDVSAMFSQSPAANYLPEGLILFDGDGQLYVRDFLVRKDGVLGKRLALAQDLTGHASLGVLLMRTGDVEAVPVSQRDAWIEKHAQQVVVTRYNGVTMEAAK